MNVLVQQAGQPPQSLQFHPWQSSTPDENISDVNASAVISTGGVTDDAALAQSAYHLFLANTTDEGIFMHASFDHALKRMVTVTQISKVVCSCKQQTGV